MNGLHGRHRIHCRYLNRASRALLNDDITWQHRSNLVFGLQGLICKMRVAGAEDLVFLEINIQFFLQSVPDIDFR